MARNDACTNVLCDLSYRHGIPFAGFVVVLFSAAPKLHLASFGIGSFVVVSCNYFYWFQFVFFWFSILHLALSGIGFFNKLLFRTKLNEFTGKVRGATRYQNGKCAFSPREISLLIGKLMNEDGLVIGQEDIFLHLQRDDSKVRLREQNRRLFLFSTFIRQRYLLKKKKYIYILNKRLSHVFYIIRL